MFGKAGLLALLTVTASFLIGVAPAAASQVGIYMTGEASEEEGNQPALAAEVSPVLISGIQDSQFNFTFESNTGINQCNEVAVDAGSVTTPTTTLGLASTYGDCELTGLWSTKTEANGCDLVIDVLNVSSPYRGDLSIDCPLFSPGIEIEDSSIFVECTITIKEQTISEGAELGTAGEGSEREVLIGVPHSTGVEYTESGRSCAGSGTSTNGDFQGGFRLTGSE